MGLYADVLFPHLLDFLMSRSHMMEQRGRALEAAHGDVLEIGFGTGLNLEYYPDSVDRLAVIDPAALLTKRVEKRIRAARMPVEKAQLQAEHLPFEDARFDCVVSTWTLCTIGDLPAALREIRRVLKPGGQFLFLEHGRSGDEKIARRQDRWNPLQRVIGVGCNLNRPIDTLIKDAGFAIDRLERFAMPKSPRIVAEHYLGSASHT